ncbi:hypothetical protein Taro_014734 [Colocasia esculenta]|uniref:xyloglucan:xyloglucosyl transferase n=1 Tax=Colocasia esculenta TaxID=4460 RepID=A0A843UIZ1_COLES|nr:hypothetical protein [Colocasia esculenta]
MTTHGKTTRSTTYKSPSQVSTPTTTTTTITIATVSFSHKYQATHTHFSPPSNSRRQRLFRVLPAFGFPSSSLMNLRVLISLSHSTMAALAGARRWVPQAFLLVGVLMVASASAGNFYQKVDVTWGDGRGQIHNNGELLTLSLDRYSGSGFQSKNQYLFCKIDMQLKLVPGNSAGTVTTYYLSSQGNAHDEIDFEFLGNLSGDPYTVHTNVFVQGKGNREQQFKLWFDPTSDFHTYSILWNPQHIIFYVDGIPIRDFKNHEANGVPFPTYQPMRIYSSLWDADDWATRGGLVKTDWTQAPFVASYRNYSDDLSCVWASGASTCASPPAWMYQQLDYAGQGAMKWVQQNYMIYNYCTDLNRFPQGLPPDSWEKENAHLVKLIAAIFTPEPCILNGKDLSLRMSSRDCQKHPQDMLWLLQSLLLVGVLMGTTASAANFYQEIDITWGGGRGQILENGQLLTLSLDRSSGSGFQSKKEYLFGKIDMQLKLVPGNSAGTDTTESEAPPSTRLCLRCANSGSSAVPLRCVGFFHHRAAACPVIFSKLSSQGSTHDEIDFEFLGNLSGEPYTLHTNMFTEGKGDREQQFKLWYDPTADFHTYSVLWNPLNVIFSVDGVPIRVFKNHETDGIPYTKNQAMRLYSSIWDAEEWATRGGLVKTDWTQAPFVASYRNFAADACVWSLGVSSCATAASAPPTAWIDEQGAGRRRSARAAGDFFTDFVVVFYVDVLNSFMGDAVLFT